MDSNYLLLGSLTAVFVFGAYFVARFQGQHHALKSRGFCASMTSSLTRKGFAWSLALPTCWILLYYAFVAYVRLSLGRWPNFGEHFDSWSLSLHEQTVRLFLPALVGSLYLAAIIFASCLFLPRWRHVSIYALCYGGGVGLAFGSLFLAPHPFLNWLLD